MKKTFKLFAIAIAACSLFVACGDDEETPAVVNGIEVNFDGNKWTAQDILGVNFSEGYNLVQLGIFKDYDNEETAPSATGYIPSKIATVVHNTGDYYFFFYQENDNDFTVMEGETYPNWQPDAFREEVTAIDLTALTVSSNCTGTMWNIPEALNAPEGTPVADLPHKDMTITMNNATWEEGEAKGKAIKTSANLIKF